MQMPGGINFSVAAKNTRWRKALMKLNRTCARLEHRIPQHPGNTLKQKSARQCFHPPRSCKADTGFCRRTAHAGLPAPRHPGATIKRIVRSLRRRARKPRRRDRCAALRVGISLKSDGTARVCDARPHWLRLDYLHRQRAGSGHHEPAPASRSGGTGRRNIKKCNLCFGRRCVLSHMVSNSHIGCYNG